MDEIAKQTPRVFKARVSNAFVAKFSSLSFLALFVSLGIGEILFSATRSFLAMAIPLVITTTAIIVTRIRYGKTKARIEICGNDIIAFDDQGNPAITENMREIAVVYRSYWSTTDSNGRSGDFFQVLFSSGALMTFSEYYDEHYMLLKILHSRTGEDPVPITWTDFEMLELQKPEARALKAREIKALT